MVVKLGHLINGRWCHSFSVENKAWTAIKNKTKPFASQDVILPNGERPIPSSRIVCGTCSMPVYPTTLKVLES